MLRFDGNMNEEERHNITNYQNIFEKVDEKGVISYYNENISRSSFEDKLKEIDRKEDEVLIVIGNIKGNTLFLGRKYEIEGLGAIGGGLNIVSNGSYVKLVDAVAMYNRKSDVIVIPTELDASFSTWSQIAELINLIIKDAKPYREMSLIEFDKFINDLKLIEVTRNLQSYIRGRVEVLEDTISNINRRINEHKDRLTGEIKNRDNSIAELSRAMKSEKDGESRLIEEVRAIINLPYVKGINMVEDVFKIQLRELTSYVSNGEAIRLPEIEIKMNMRTSDIRFMCKEDDRIRGFWNSCHPHVNEMGVACYGNVDATIAELTAQQELLALTTILVNYLQSVNANDPAGESYRNWLIVCPETGEELEDQGLICPECGNDTDEILTCDCCEDTVCNNCGYSINHGDEFVCEQCFEYETSYCETCDTIHFNESMGYCEDCDEYVCLDSLTEYGEYGRLCTGCLQNRRDEENNEQEDDNLMTCERCGIQGDLQEIVQRNDGVFRCNECEER